jgi:hypothetical protein
MDAMRDLPMASASGSRSSLGSWLLATGSKITTIPGHNNPSFEVLWGREKKCVVEWRERTATAYQRPILTQKTNGKKGLISKTTDSQAQRDQNTSIKRKELQQQELEDSRKCRDKKEDKIVEREKTPNAKLTHTPAMSPTATPQKESLCLSLSTRLDACTKPLFLLLAKIVNDVILELF